MPQIQRTEDDRLLVSNRTQSRLVESEADARRTLYTWGHTDISINKALAELRREGAEAGADRGWRVVRPEAAGAPEPAPVIAAESAPPRRRGRNKAAAAEPAATPEPAAPAPAAPAEPRAEPAPEAIKPARTRAPRRSRARAAAPEATAEERDGAESTGSPGAEAPSPAPAPARKRRSRRAAPAAGEPAEPEPAAEAAPPAPPAPEAPVVEAPVAEERPASKPRRRRAARPAETESDAGVAGGGAVAAADPQQRALLLSRQLAEALLELERGTLPFARGPWAELRGRAEHIAACLSGRTPRD